MRDSCYSQLICFVMLIACETTVFIYIEICMYTYIMHYINTHTHTHTLVHAYNSGFSLVGEGDTLTHLTSSSIKSPPSSPTHIWHPFYCFCIGFSKNKCMPSSPSPSKNYAKISPIFAVAPGRTLQIKKLPKF